MDSQSIFRKPTEQERQDFIPIMGVAKTDPTTQFIQELCKHEQKAIKAKKPFAAKVARDDFNDAIADQVKTSQRKNGYVNWAEIKLPKIDWTKYSDLKNFEQIEEGEESEPANKTNPAHLQKYIVYKFKGYSDKYIVFQ